MFLSDTQESALQSLADIVREETGNGRLIVRFLVDLMQGSLENTKPCHRLDAARQLLNLGFAPAHAFIAANAPAPRSAQRRTPAPSSQQSAPADLHQDLAALICEETDNGRAAVRFLVDVMQGNLHDFKPHHRLSAAKELLRRGFDAPAPAPETAAGNSDSAPENSAANSVPAEVPAKPSRSYGNRYLEEHGPFNFDSYDEEDFHRDCYGADALKHVLGSEAAVKAATAAVLDYRCGIGWYRRKPEETIDPLIQLAAVPADAPLPEDIYGYQALLYIYGSECAARVAAHGAYQYRRHCLSLASRPGYNLDLSQDGDSSDFPPGQKERPPPEEPSVPTPAPARIRLDGPGIAVDSTNPDGYLQHALSNL